MRWNAAFAYLDPVRNRPNLTIMANCPVDQLVLKGDRVAGVRYIGPDGPAEVQAERVVVAGGTYGSPAVLLRSGIGEPDELRALGIEPTVPLPGVGRNLHDHSAAHLQFRRQRRAGIGNARVCGARGCLRSKRSPSSVRYSIRR